MTQSERVHMPTFAGATEWLNYEPLGPAELRGRVVLVNFWTWTCINWLRQEPYVRAWSRAYRDDGLVVVGVHTPEFSFEYDADGVRLATAEREIDYPVAVDVAGQVEGFRSVGFGTGRLERQERPSCERPGRFTELAPQREVDPQVIATVGGAGRDGAATCVVLGTLRTEGCRRRSRSLRRAASRFSRAASRCCSADARTRAS